MIKALGATGDGTPLVILGLSGENVTRLTADEPIRFNLSQLGLPPTMVVIVYGRTEEAITARLQDVGLLDLADPEVETIGIPGRPDAGPKSFTCPRCGMTSHHPKDVAEGYCGACHDWTGKPAG